MGKESTKGKRFLKSLLINFFPGKSERKEFKGLRHFIENNDPSIEQLKNKIDQIIAKRG